MTFNYSPNDKNRKSKGSRAPKREVARVEREVREEKKETTKLKEILVDTLPSAEIAEIVADGISVGYDVLSGFDPTGISSAIGTVGHALHLFDPKPPRPAKDLCLSKVFDTVHELRCHLYSIAQGGLALNPNVPILTAFYAMLLRHAVKSKVRLPVWGAMNEKVLELNNQGLTRVDDSTRDSFTRCSGVCAAQQLLLERHFDAMELHLAPGPCVSPFQFSGLWPVGIG